MIILLNAQTKVNILGSRLSKNKLDKSTHQILQKKPKTNPSHKDGLKIF